MGPLALLRGGLPCHLLVELGKVGEVAVPHLGGNDVHRQIGGGQEDLGQVELFLDDVLLDGDPCLLFEPLGQIVGAQVDVIRQLRALEVLLDVVVDVLDDLLDLVAGGGLLLARVSVM